MQFSKLDTVDGILKKRQGRQSERENCWGMEVDIKGEKTHRERRGDMSGCLQGGVIPSCKQVITSNCVLMRLHGEDNNNL